MIGPLYDEVEESGASGEPPDAGPIDLDLGLPKAAPAAGPPTPASIRSRLHVICALYAHTPQPDRRLGAARSPRTDDPGGGRVAGRAPAGQRVAAPGHARGRLTLWA